MVSGEHLLERHIAATKVQACRRADVGGWTALAGCRATNIADTEFSPSSVAGAHKRATMTSRRHDVVDRPLVVMRRSTAFAVWPISSAASASSVRLYSRRATNFDGCNGNAARDMTNWLLVRG